MADSISPVQVKAIRAMLLEEGMKEAIQLLQESSALLKPADQSELDSYQIRLRDLERTNRQGIIDRDKYDANRTKLETDFLAFLRILAQPIAPKTDVQVSSISPESRKIIENLVTQGRMESAIDELERVAATLPKDLKIQCTTLIANWKDLRRSKNMGLIDYKTQSMRTSQITMSLLEMISN